LKRDGSPMTNASSKKLKTGDVEVDVAALSHGVPQEEATVEDVEVPYNIASKSQQTASSLKKVGTKKKRLGRKGVHTSHSTIPIDWELLPTGLGSINAFYRLDNSRKYFTKS
ncbi:hypothetical protein Tco_0406762, partial [Tanacetum coccineum]